MYNEFDSQQFYKYISFTFLNQLHSSIDVRSIVKLKLSAYFVQLRRIELCYLK